MRSRALRCGIGVVACWFVANLVCSERWAFALTMIPLSFEDTVSEADRIVRGRVEEVRSGRDESDFAVTWVTVRVVETLKGPRDTELTFKQLSASSDGGDVLPRYQTNSDIVLFLRRPSRLGLTSPVGFAQGYYVIDPPAGVGSASGSDDGTSPGAYTRLDSARTEAFLNEVRALVGVAR